MIHEEREIIVEVLNEDFAVNTFLLYQFIRRMITPFEKWDAYKQGIIDKNGKVLRKRSSLTRASEKKSFQLWDVFILNLKKLINKIPGGRSKLGSFAAALFLIKEGKSYTENDVDKLCSDFSTFLLQITEDVYEMNELLVLGNKMCIDEAIANSVAAGGVAGLDPETPDDVIVHGKPSMLRRKKKKKKETFKNRFGAIKPTE